MEKKKMSRSLNRNNNNNNNGDIIVTSHNWPECIPCPGAMLIGCIIVWTTRSDSTKTNFGRVSLPPFVCAEPVSLRHSQGYRSKLFYELRWAAEKKPIYICCMYVQSVYTARPEDQLCESCLFRRTAAVVYPQPQAIPFIYIWWIRNLDCLYY